MGMTTEPTTAEEREMWLTALEAAYGTSEFARPLADSALERQQRLIADIERLEGELDNEIHDVQMIGRIASAVYDEITGGRISKPNTEAHHIIGEAEARTQEALDEREKEVREEIGAERDALQEQLRTHGRALFAERVAHAHRRICRNCTSGVGNKGCPVWQELNEESEALVASVKIHAAGDKP